MTVIWIGMMRFMNRIIFSALMLTIAACATYPPAVLLDPVPVARHAEPFQSASSVQENRGRIAGLPDADLWLNVTGEHMGWLHRNVQKVFPTVDVYREGPVRELSYRLMDEIARFPIEAKTESDSETETDSGTMAFTDLLDSDQSAVMGMVILYKGEIVFEHYPRQQYYEKPIYWSVAKVLVSTLVGMLEDRGQIDVSLPIETYIPELAGSAYEGILIRNILDMATGVDCPENYEDPDSCYYVYSKTIGEGYFTKDSPENPYTYVAGLEVGKFAEQGTSYEYSGVNTFLLAWLVEKISGLPLQELFTREVWSRIGAEADGAYMAPRFGVPNSSGGFMSRMRDMARFGLLFTPSYTVVSDEKIVSDRLIKTIRDDGNPSILENARGAEPGNGRPANVKHNAYQWDLIFTNNDFFKGGWGGQGLLVNPDKDLVAVYSGYTKDDYSEVNTLPLLRKVLNGVFPDYSEPR
jgi:CubicO group peptidase (beta-lactamase class C family)